MKWLWILWDNVYLSEMDRIFFLSKFKSWWFTLYFNGFYWEIYYGVKEILSCCYYSFRERKVFTKNNSLRIISAKGMLFTSSEIVLGSPALEYSWLAQLKLNFNKFVLVKNFHLIDSLESIYYKLVLNIKWNFISSRVYSHLRTVNPHDKIFMLKNLLSGLELHIP